MNFSKKSIIFVGSFALTLAFGAQAKVVSANSAINVPDYDAVATKNNWWTFTDDSTTKRKLRLPQGTKVKVTWVVTNKYGRFHKIYSRDYKKYYGMIDDRGAAPTPINVTPYQKMVNNNAAQTFSDYEGNKPFKQIKAGSVVQVTRTLENDYGQFAKININGVDYGWIPFKYLSNIDNTYPEKANGISRISYNTNYVTGRTTPNVKVAFGHWAGNKYFRDSNDTVSDNNGYFTITISTKVLPNTTYSIYSTKLNNNKAVRQDAISAHNLLAFGDSITKANEAKTSSYVITAAHSAKYDVSVAAQSGGTISGNSWNSLQTQINNVGVANLKYYDKISIGFGTNDWRYTNLSLGQLQNTLNQYISIIKKGNPSAEIYGVLPSPRYINSYDTELTVNDKMSGGYTFSQLTDALNQTYKNDGINSLDWRTTGIVFDHTSFYDGVQHPTVAMHQQMAPFYQSLITDSVK